MGDHTKTDPSIILFSFPPVVLNEASKTIKEIDIFEPRGTPVLILTMQQPPATHVKLFI